MNQGMMNTVLAAIVGGVVGASVVFFTSGSKVDTNNLELESLKVANLSITKEAVLLNTDGNVELVIKDGSVLAEKVILGNKLVGQQFQGHAMVANRVFVTPDNLVQTPMDKWKFYAEIGASTEAGGEVVVRSVAGPALVGKATELGALMRMGYTPEGGPQVLALQNFDRRPLAVSFDMSEQQRQILNTPTNSAGIVQPSPNSFNGEGAPFSPNGLRTASPTDQGTF